ncbi:hypothetical protein JOD57_003874 [Geodermatophilus bullaregiensis]|uniref:hypothetical protein n=1 Tax=Geodermatophilus bullaregiensis TaxID=1564160 RepID=UPI00195904EC|nr:hypothetical protein [Geodermatophilus bullaregiensis]MBM7808037.1 hypothetical protein [Geodermatophilus bullaregiensis]
MSEDEALARVRLTDEPDDVPRTTGSLVASFAARLGALGHVTGGEAIGSELAGFAALGRDVARTSEGDRMRHMLAAGRVGANAEELWRALRVEDWLSQMPPAPVLDHLRNDLALLLADDLPEVLASAPESASVAAATRPEPQPVHAVDVLLGLWAYGRELVRAVGTIAGEVDTGVVARPEWEPGPTLDGTLLR